MLVDALRTIRHRRTISALQRRLERYETEIDEKIDQARRAGERDEADSLVSEFFFEKDQFESQISRLETRFLVSEARRYLIPIPPTRTKGTWEQTKYDERWVLTYQAMQELRRNIRNERRERSDPVKTWLALVTGLVGALIGLAAIFH